ncbi:pilus assembly protein TadG-related protein [Botrimarina sp.]|uniref:pilus assembly protein TadG-related protein n=1 Tax=Botrimarina sp. TaxID=2795802 RepID=UPI0032EBB472
MVTPFKAHRRGPAGRRGTVTVLAAFFSIVMLGMVAFSVDIGYLLSVKEEMQRTADAAAMAAVWEYAQKLADGEAQIDCDVSGRASAASVASGNEVANLPPEINQNSGNSATGDLVFGYVPDLRNPAQMDTAYRDLFNVAKVKIRRDGTLNGEAPLFFAAVFGLHSTSLEAEAMAGLVRDVGGFEAPSSGKNLDLLPFTLDVPTHDAWLAGAGDDSWTYDESSGLVYPGPDGKPEVNLYPQDTGSPGNRGTVDIGGSNNSTNDIARQILQGVSDGDLAALGKPLALDHNGELTLNGDTGISAGVKDELAAIRGEPRVIPIFREVNGPGNNAIYTIVRWQGIRIMDVKLTGPMKKKHVTIQMAPVLSEGVIQSGKAGSSNFVFSPVVLIQ